jgi:hypothetical protein
MQLIAQAEAQHLITKVIFSCNQRKEQREGGRESGRERGYPGS